MAITSNSTLRGDSRKNNVSKIISEDFDKYKNLRTKVATIVVSQIDSQDGWYSLQKTNKVLNAHPEIDTTRFCDFQEFLKKVFEVDYATEDRNGIEYVRLNAIKYAKISAKKRLMDFAFFPSPNEDIYGFDAALQDLAENKALHEIWYYGSSNQGKYPILESYLCQTFARLQDQDLEHADDSNWQKRIIIDENESNAIFNTGLVSHLFDPIYAVFNKNTFGGRQKWAFAMFVKSDDKEDQVLTRIFGDKRPLPAFYYASTSELVYDTRKKISSYNWDHIIDRCDRMPIEFLEDNVNFDYDRPHDREFWNDLASAIKDNSRVKKRFINRIEEAIEYALKRVEWNFKTSIPIYYPGQKTISFLLPLSLSTDEIDVDRIDVALVLEATDSNAYIAHTILTLEQAYKSARLITRPDSDWLMASNVQVSEDVNEDEDEFEEELVPVETIEDSAEEHLAQESSTLKSTIGPKILGKIELPSISKKSIFEKESQGKRLFIEDGNIYEGRIILNNGFKNIMCELFPHPLRIKGDSINGDYREDEVVEFVAKSEPNPKDSTKLFWYAIDVKLKD